MYENGDIDEDSDGATSFEKRIHPRRIPVPRHKGENKNSRPVGNKAITRVSRRLVSLEEGILESAVTKAVQDLVDTRLITHLPSTSLMTSKESDQIFNARYRDNPEKFNSMAKRAIIAANRKHHTIPAQLGEIEVFGLKGEKRGIFFVGAEITARDEPSLLSEERHTFLSRLLPEEFGLLDRFQKNFMHHVGLVRSDEPDTANQLAAALKNSPIPGMNVQLDPARASNAAYMTLRTY